ncbi:hypothetical protein ACOMHN_000722 [Nucella lapillus]
MPSHHHPPLSSCSLLLLLLPLLLVLTWPQGSRVEGHGRLIDPPSRASMWRHGFDSPRDYDDNQGYCGGQAQLWNRFNGRCGVCGDPWEPRPRAHERGGQFYDGTPVRVYRQGDVITVVTGITANHRGWMEYRLCPYDSPGPGDVERDDVSGALVEVRQACLDRHVLQLADGSGTRYFLPKPYRVGQYSVDLQLPAHVSCDKCLLQWKWNVANSWGTDPDGTSCVGCGPQEQFYACADIVIQPIDYPPDYPDYPDYHPVATEPPPATRRPPERVTPRRVTFPPTRPPALPTSLPRGSRPRVHTPHHPARPPTTHRPPATTHRPKPPTTTPSTTTTTTTTTPTTTTDSNPQPKQPSSAASFWQWLVHHRLKQKKPSTPLLAGEPTRGSGEGSAVLPWWKKLKQPSQKSFWTHLSGLKAMKDTLLGGTGSTVVSTVKPVLKTISTLTTKHRAQELTESSINSNATSVQQRLSNILSLAERLKDAASSMLATGNLPLSAHKTTNNETKNPTKSVSSGGQSVRDKQSVMSVDVLPWLQTVQSRETEFVSKTLQTPNLRLAPKEGTALSANEHDNAMADFSWHPSSEDADLNIVAYAAMLVPPTKHNDGRKPSTWRKRTNQIAADASRDQPLSGVGGDEEQWIPSLANDQAREESRDHFPTNEHARRAVEQDSANENVIPLHDITEKGSTQNELNSPDSGKRWEVKNALFPQGRNVHFVPTGLDDQHLSEGGYPPPPPPPQPGPPACSPRQQWAWHRQTWAWCHMYCSRGLCLHAYCLCV